MMKGAAGPEGPMIYDLTQDKFLWFPFSVLKWPVLGSERSDIGSERPDLGSERSTLGL